MKNWKTAIALAILALLVLASVGGCVGKPKSAEDEYWEHLLAIVDATSKVPPHDEHIRAYYEGNFDKAIEILKESKKLEEQAYAHANLAVNLPVNASMKEFAQANLEVTRYGILYHEKRIEAFEYLKQGKEDEALKLIEESNKYADLGKEWAIKGAEVSEKLRKEWAIKGAEVSRNVGGRQ